jgi:hypothetical protein
VRSDEVRGKQFSSTWNDDHDRYDKNQVDAFLDAAGIRLAAMESTDRPERPLVSGAILADWAEWADSTRFSTTRRLREGYATAEVDAFRKELRDTFLGVRQPPWPGSRNRSGPKRATTLWFSTTRGWSRPGYDVQEVDAFLNMAKLRLAAITPDIESPCTGTPRGQDRRSAGKCFRRPTRYPPMHAIRLRPSSASGTDSSSSLENVPRP